MEQIFVDKMSDGAGQLGIMLSEGQLGQFYRYYELLTEWNKMVNLTAITELEDIVSKHFIDSLSLAYLAKEGNWMDASLIDVGTGAGFPGIPLKIAFPELEITLLDSLNKRVKFLEQVIGELGLSGIRSIHGRAEDYGRNPDYREKYDLAVSRAVANISVLSEYCLPFVKTGGKFVSYKSGKIDEEMAAGKKAIEILGGGVEEIVRFKLSGTEADRSLVVIKKKNRTAKRFPRKSGMPSKEPIC